MRKATERMPRGNWAEEDQVGTVTLPFDDRHRRRIRLSDDEGAPFLLDLTEAEYMHDGDGLRLEEGGLIKVLAAKEAILDIKCLDAGHAAKVSWHIGNRHIPLQVLVDGRLRIRADHVLAEMLRGLGAVVSETNDAFSPEPGAYSSEGHGHHDH